MRRILFSVLFAATVALGNTQTLVPVDKAYSETSVNTTVFRNNSIVTFKGWQYIAYYDADGFVTLGKRRQGSDKWQIEHSKYKGKVSDAHNVISIMLDGKGYIHASFDHHGNKLKYCRSVEPYSLKLGELQPMTGVDEKDVTYPEFYYLKGGNLLFAYRSGASGRGNLVLNRYDIKQQKWSRVQNILIDGENKRNAYWQLYVDSKGSIHVSWVWRETWMVETNHDLCYARSDDGGVTWKRTDGSTYTLPINAANAEYACKIPQKSELINQTSMSTDADGNPYIATYWRDQNSNVPQYRVVWHDKTGWHNQQVSDRKEPFSLSGGGTKCIPIARPRMAVNGNRAYYVFRDVERDSKVSMYYTDDIHSGKWQCRDLTDFSVSAWEPSIDTELWKKKHILQIFVENTPQGDGEKKVVTEPQMVYVLEYKHRNVE